MYEEKEEHKIVENSMTSKEIKDFFIKALGG